MVSDDFTLANLTMHSCFLASYKIKLGDRIIFFVCCIAEDAEVTVLPAGSTINITFYVAYPHRVSLKCSS